MKKDPSKYADYFGGTMKCVMKTTKRIILKLWGVTPRRIRKIVIRIFPQKILLWLRYTSIYPIEIPVVSFLPNQELILLELPQRYKPAMPNGLAYVHNIVKATGIHFQTVDLNIIFYHRYHSRRILNGLDRVTSPNGYVMPYDPWDTNSADEWNKTDVIDYFRPEINEIIKSLVQARPKIIGISLSDTNRVVALEVVKGVRSLYPEVIILVGGYDCVYHYVAPHIFSEYDYMVIGEAELTLGPLLKALVIGEKPKNLPGVISKYDSPERTWVDSPLLQDLDSIDFPRYEWIDLNLYRTYNGEKVVPMLSSRGCRWSRCRFCAECFTWRKRSPKKVVDEMEWFYKHGHSNFLFNESDMNGDPDSLLEICDEIIRRRLKITFAGELRIHKRGSLEFFRHLHKAGCRSLAFGVDGWTNHTLRLHNKGCTMDMVEENLRNCHKAGISVNVNMVIGVPGETEEDISESINNIIACKSYIDCFQNLNILLLKAGSEYYLNPERYDICFHGEKRELYIKYPYIIPPDLWHSINPYIDLNVRVERLKRIYYALNAAGIYVGSYAAWEVVRDSKLCSAN